VHAELVTSAASQWNEYLMVGGSMIGVRVERRDETVTMHYFHQDDLGSIAVVSDENGVVFERDAYDTWGKRRFASGPDDPAGSIISRTNLRPSDQRISDGAGGRAQSDGGCRSRIVTPREPR
jgi:hypothetical protein